MICGKTKNLLKTIETITTNTIITTILNNGWCTQIHQLFSADKVTLAIMPTYPPVSQNNYNILRKR